MQKHEYCIGDYVMVDPGTYRAIEYNLKQEPAYAGIYYLSQSEVGQIYDIIRTRWDTFSYNIALQDCIIETYAKDIVLFE